MATKFKSIIIKGNEIFAEIEKRNAHLDHPDAIIIPQDTQKIIDQLDRLISSLPDIQSPQNVDELLTAELKRRAVGERGELSSQLSSEVPTLEETLAIYNIPPQDINSLPEWLHKNKPAVVSANQRLIEEHITHRQVKVFMGSSELKSQAETLVLNALISLKSVLRNHFLKLPGVSDFLDNYHIVIDSIETRAYTNWIANVMDITKGEELPAGKSERRAYLAELKKRLHADRRLAALHREVKALCKKFPIPESFV